jgi:hypothetical protein
MMPVTRYLSPGAAVERAVRVRCRGAWVQAQVRLPQAAEVLTCQFVTVTVAAVT